MQWFRTASAEDLERAELPLTGLLTRPSVGIAAIERVEARLARLGCRLPTSLRSFYEATDGLLEAGAFGERVRPLAELDWMRATNADLLDVWGASDDGDEDAGLLRRALQIGGNDEGDYWFLDPADHRDGEWAAYTWYPSGGFDPGALRQLRGHAG